MKWKAFNCRRIVNRHWRWWKLFNAAGHVSANILGALELSPSLACGSALILRGNFLLQAGKIEKDLPAKGRKGLHNTVAGFRANSVVRYPAKGSICLTLAPLLYNCFMKESAPFRVHEQSIRLIGDQDTRELLICWYLTHFLEPEV